MLVFLLQHVCTALNGYFVQVALCKRKQRGTKKLVVAAGVTVSVWFNVLRVVLMCCAVMFTR